MGKKERVVMFTGIFSPFTTMFSKAMFLRFFEISGSVKSQNDQGSPVSLILQTILCLVLQIFFYT